MNNNERKCFFKTPDNLMACLMLLLSIGLGLGFSCREKSQIYVFQDVDMANTFGYNEQCSLVNDREYLRNEVLVFRQDDSLYGYRLNETSALRLVGLPGDQVYVDKGRIYINNKIVPLRPSDKRPYIVNLASTLEYKSRVEFAEKYYGYMLNDNYGFINLDSIEYRSFQPGQQIYSLEQFKLDSIADSILVIKVNTLNQKNTLSLLRIPHKGDTLEVTFSNSKYYKHGLRSATKLEGNRYVFNENMYCLIGDNWGYAMDSRSYGLIAESQIVGTLVAKK